MASNIADDVARRASKYADDADAEKIRLKEDNQYLRAALRLADVEVTDCNSCNRLSADVQTYHEFPMHEYPQRSPETRRASDICDKRRQIKCFNAERCRTYYCSVCVTDKPELIVKVHPVFRYQATEAYCTGVVPCSDSIHSVHRPECCKRYNPDMVREEEYSCTQCMDMVNSSGQIRWPPTVKSTVHE